MYHPPAIRSDRVNILIVKSVLVFRMNARTRCLAGGIYP